MDVEIIDSDGRTLCRKHARDPMVSKAMRTEGYSVRPAEIQPVPPYEKYRHPPGCPDGDWCAGNSVCYWACDYWGDDENFDVHDLSLHELLQRI